MLKTRIDLRPRQRILGGLLKSPYHRWPEEPSCTGTGNFAAFVYAIWIKQRPGETVMLVKAGITPAQAQSDAKSVTII
jgi:hypothetical protein